MSDEFRVHDLAAARHRRPGKVDSPEPVIEYRVEPVVWLMAVGLAEGDPGRIVVVDEDEVVVFNSPRAAKRWRRAIASDDLIVGQARSFEELLARANIIHNRGATDHPHPTDRH